jgi:hypothetical protein
MTDCIIDDKKLGLKLSNAKQPASLETKGGSSSLANGSMFMNFFWSGLFSVRPLGAVAIEGL